MIYPAVSIIVITYNEEERIRSCLDSILSLDYPRERYEIIVVDSGTDRTAELVKGYAKVKLVRSGERNFALSRNLGVNNARNEIIAFTDADCVVPENWLKVLVTSLNDQGIAGVGGNAFPPPESSCLGRWIACLGLPAGGAIGLDANIREIGQGVNSLSTCNVIYRKKVLEKVGGFDETLRLGDEDTEIAERIKRAGYSLRYESASFVYHRVRDSFRDFMAWNFRRGRARSHLRKVSPLRLLSEPFSPLWLLVGITGMLILKFPLALILPLIAWMALLAVMFLGTKKFRLLLQRRRRAKVSGFVLISFIPLLFYLRRLTVNVAQWYCLSRKV